MATEASYRQPGVTVSLESLWRLTSAVNSVWCCPMSGFCVSCSKQLFLILNTNDWLTKAVWFNFPEDGPGKVVSFFFACSTLKSVHNCIMHSLTSYASNLLIMYLAIIRQLGLNEKWQCIGHRRAKCVFRRLADLGWAASSCKAKRLCTWLLAEKCICSWSAFLLFKVFIHWLLWNGRKSSCLKCQWNGWEI